MLAVPFGMEGGTFGNDFDDAVESAADWLMETARAAMMRGTELKTGGLGNSPTHGGRVVAIAVDCQLDPSQAVTAADAAKMLGVSTARIAQMCGSGMLASWKSGSKRMVSVASIEARLAARPRSGRPKRKAAV